MPSFIEIASCTMQTGVDAFAVSSKEPLYAPRESCAIANGIQLLLADEVESLDRSEALKKIDTFMPFLISLNEAADIGVSARLFRGRAANDNFPQLLELQNKVFSDMEHWKQVFEKKHPELRSISSAIEDDFLLLSHNREEFADDVPTFLELDSGIFVAGIIGVLEPSVLNQAGIYLNAPCNSKNDLVEKYSLFLIDDNEKNDYTLLQRKIRALHAAEMYLKINDDHRGRDIDKRLRLPSFAQMEGLKEKHNLNTLQNKYASVFQEGGIPNIAVKAAEKLMEATSVYKAGRACLDSGVDHEQIGRQCGSHQFTTTLRHKMDPTLHTLFTSG